MPTSSTFIGVKPEPLVGVPVDAIVGHNMYRLRKREKPKLSQAKVAFALTQLTGTNWDQQTVSQAEKGQRPFRVVDLFMAARLFGVSPIRLLLPDPPEAINADDAEKTWVAESPWARAVRIGTLDFWPDDVIREFIMDPRDGDPTAASWKEGWPTRIGQPLHDWIEQLRESVIGDDGFDLDMWVQGSWEGESLDENFERQRQRREHT